VVFAKTFPVSGKISAGTRSVAGQALGKPRPPEEARLYRDRVGLCGVCRRGRALKAWLRLPGAWSK
jgi:hypothetical protein